MVEGKSDISLHSHCFQLLIFLLVLQENAGHYPVLASLAQDYLTISATSCAVERTFSSAADIAVPARGSLSPKTISRSVGCREWLRAGIQVDGRFSEALAYLTSFAKFGKKKIRSS